MGIWSSLSSLLAGITLEALLQILAALLEQFAHVSSSYTGQFLLHVNTGVVS